MVLGHQQWTRGHIITTESQQQKTLALWCLGPLGCLRRHSFGLYLQCHLNHSWIEEYSQTVTKLVDHLVKHLFGHVYNKATYKTL